MEKARNSQQNSAKGARIAVSLVKAASENQIACRHGRASIYAARAQNVNPAAGRSTSAIELCGKPTGYSATNTGVAHATGRLPAVASRESRNSPSNENALSANMAVRVTSAEYPATRQASASHAITSGGCALDGVDCGMSDPVRNKSRAAGT